MLTVHAESIESVRDAANVIKAEFHRVFCIVCSPLILHWPEWNLTTLRCTKLCVLSYSSLIDKIHNFCSRLFVSIEYKIHCYVGSFDVIGLLGKFDLRNYKEDFGSGSSWAMLHRLQRTSSSKHLFFSLT